MGGCIISRNLDSAKVCGSWSDEWLPYGRLKIARGIYAHFCRAIDDWCDGGICFEWNLTLCDETIPPELCEELKKKLPKSWPPIPW